jgi:hypothetical protein
MAFMNVRPMSWTIASGPAFVWIAIAPLPGQPGGRFRARTMRVSRSK